jgi:hypothetical protein
VQGAKIIPFSRRYLVWEPGNDGTSNEINSILQLPYERGKRARVCGILNFTTCRAVQTENWKSKTDPRHNTFLSQHCVTRASQCLKMSHVTIYL